METEEDSGAVAWPGFVDILSAVIIMFVFFVMIMAIIMATLSQQEKEQAEAKAQETQLEELLDQQGYSLDKFKKIEEERDQLHEEVQELELKLSQATRGVAATGEQDIAAKNKTLRIYFNDSSTVLTETSIAEIEKFIKSFYPNGIPKSVQIMSHDSGLSLAFSVNREMSLTRAMNVRNILLKKNTPSDRIMLRVKKHKKDTRQKHGFLEITIQ